MFNNLQVKILMTLGFCSSISLAQGVSCRDIFAGKGAEIQRLDGYEFSVANQSLADRSFQVGQLISRQSVDTVNPKNVKGLRFDKNGLYVSDQFASREQLSQFFPEVLIQQMENEARSVVSQIKLVSDPAQRNELIKNHLVDLKLRAYLGHQLMSSLTQMRFLFSEIINSPDINNLLGPIRKLLLMYKEIDSNKTESNGLNISKLKSKEIFSFFFGDRYRDLDLKDVDLKSGQDLESKQNFSSYQILAHKLKMSRLNPAYKILASKPEFFNRSLLSYVTSSFYVDRYGSGVWGPESSLNVFQKQDFRSKEKSEKLSLLYIHLLKLQLMQSENSGLNKEISEEIDRIQKQEEQLRQDSVSPLLGIA